MKILFAASEIFPYAKSGGLADVAQALPHSLNKHLNIVCVMPLYGFMSRDLLKKNDISFDVILGKSIYNITLYTANNNGVTTYFVHTPLISDSQDFYTNHSGSYANNNPHFGIFCAAILELAKFLDVNIVHLNDWHTALAALWIRECMPNIKTIFTIHNLAYQGLFSMQTLENMGIDKKYFTMDGIEFYNKLSFMKAGIAYSDLVTTVSPQYAKEIMSEKFGCGLHTFLNEHSEKVSGILNGIDYELFNPKTDRALVSQFSSKNIDLKYLNKKALLDELGFELSQKPLFVMVSRLEEQKGFDILLDALEDLLNKELNLIILGEGANKYRQKLESVAQKHDNFCLKFGYDEDFAHRIYAGADFLLMPSLFEPCGLNQMIAMRYGTIAIVHGVGGLLDSVHENKMECGEGIVFLEHTKEELICAVERALKLNNDTQKKKKIISFNMKCDFSFDKRALSYIELYKRLSA
jgi:starch synthase